METRTKQAPMGSAVTNCMVTEDSEFDEADLTRKKSRHAKNLKIVEKYRRLRLQSWKQILLMASTDENMLPIPGVTVFKLQFHRINESYGEQRLNLASCYNDPINGRVQNDSFGCVRILKHLILTNVMSSKVK